MVYRCIRPDWASKSVGPKVIEGELSEKRLRELNASGYNVYFFPNYPSKYVKGTSVTGDKVDVFTRVFVDMDLKDGTWKDKDSFISYVGEVGIAPTQVVDSGNGIHVYWKISDLEPMSYLRLQRRLCRLFKTDPATSLLSQLMRAPGFMNTKKKDNIKPCQELFIQDIEYTCEQLDKLLPNITPDDENYCKVHYDKTYNKTAAMAVDEKLPNKFYKLLKDMPELKTLWSTISDDRSAADYRIGHLLFAHGFTKDEAMSVLFHSVKGSERAPVHRVSYAQNIVDKIWTYEVNGLDLSNTVGELLRKFGKDIKGTRFPCYPWLDNTEHGFRLGQVIGLVAGSGVGKTAVALNMFMGFVKNNPDYEHFFIPLEQTPNEIASRWQTMCGDETHLYEKVHVMSNYDESGTFRHLSLDDIKTYLLKFKELTKKKIGCVVMDHIGALKKKGKNGENQDLMDICHAMKGFAVETNTLVVMQSQTQREKAGIGDLELDKDAAYGTVYFESYCDYLITVWQPLKRCYKEESCPTVTALKFCKIRHKRKTKDVIQEDTPYILLFDSETEGLRELTEDEDKSFTYFNSRATNLRKKDKKTDLVQYVSLKEVKDESSSAVVQ